MRLAMHVVSGTNSHAVDHRSRLPSVLASTEPGVSKILHVNPLLIVLASVRVGNEQATGRVERHCPLICPFVQTSPPPELLGVLDALLARQGGIE